jgi:hypothetical protein
MLVNNNVRYNVAIGSHRQPIENARAVTAYLEPVRKVLVLAVRDFSRPPFFHTSPRKTRFFSILAFSAQKNLFLGVDFL